ncbi:MAG: hypothetical protein COW63_08870 [Bacteroidetes bacterium CG18_big_fil_WC_8_21_14_2_50_41_14]|nr:MAG: hypothetical protein COW63_08870 [Bacteroidetes bacterium CG18_big_fil_WC_8_21_14_2_50_41_14]
MKTILKYTFALVLLTFTFNANAIAPVISPLLAEEAYIDDIPFSTQHVFDSILDLSLTDTYDLSEEVYIQDIPFNTAEIASENLDATSFDLEEESYINDIPFSTELYAKQ